MARLPEPPEGYRTIAFDDESLPLHVRRNEAIRQMTLALKESKGRGIAHAKAEADYYTAKALDTDMLLNAGYTATSTSDKVKGEQRTNEALERRIAEKIGYDNACEAVQCFKKIASILNDDIQREWEQARRTM
jgi:hypothetical protein